MSERQTGEKGQPGPELRVPRGAGAVPDRLGPQSGRKWGYQGQLGSGPRLKGPRAPPASLDRLHYRQRTGPASPRGAAESRRAGRGSEVLQVQRRGARQPCPRWLAGCPLVSLPSAGLPPRAAPGPAAGLGGAARARPPGRGSPPASTCRGARGAGSPADAFIAAAAAAAAASSFLLCRLLLGPGWGLCASSSARPSAPGGGRLRRRRRRPRRWWRWRGPRNFAPLCAPPRRRRAGSAAFPTILTPGGELSGGDSTLLCPTAHPPAHLMPGSRVGEGEEATQPR